MFTVLVTLIKQRVVTALTFFPMRAASTTQIGASFALQAEGVADIVGLYFLQKARQLQSLVEVEIVKENVSARDSSYAGINFINDYPKLSPYPSHHPTCPK